MEPPRPGKSLMLIDWSRQGVAVDIVCNLRGWLGFNNLLLLTVFRVQTRWDRIIEEAGLRNRDRSRHKVEVLVLRAGYQGRCHAFRQSECTERDQGVSVLPERPQNSAEFLTYDGVIRLLIFAGCRGDLDVTVDTLRQPGIQLLFREEPLC